MRLTRITIDPAQCGGAPCVRGLRIPVSTVVGMVAEGMDAAAIRHHLPDLEADDIRESLLFAAEAANFRDYARVAS